MKGLKGNFMSKILKQLKTLAETAHAAFDLEPLISGSIAIWNVPKGYGLKLEKYINDAFKAENAKALKRLEQRGVKFTKNIYRVSIDKSTIEDNNSCNFRIAAKYIGPYLAKPIPGVYNSRDDLNKFLEKILRAATNTMLKGKPVVAEKPNKKMTITYQSAYAQLIGCFEHDSMDIRINPTRTDYTNLVKDNMPVAVHNIAIHLKQIAPSALLYSMNAAGLPYLKRVGQVVDQIVASRTRAK